MSELYYVKRNVTNMHTTPDEMSEVDSQAIYATEVVILEKTTHWIKVRTPDLYSGWVLEAHIEKRKEYYPSTPTIAKVKTLFAHVYWVNDTSPHPPMLTLCFESYVEVLSSSQELENRWIQVRLLDGQLGWMQKGDLSFDPKLLSLHEMLVLSRQFMGLPYTWGGASSFGFDCSGFVQMLYRQMGIILHRNSKDQVNTKGAFSVPISELLPGDLVFFGPTRDKINHVGLYLEEGNFIHTKANILSGSPVVQVSNLNSPTWPEEYICARRVAHL